LSYLQPAGSSHISWKWGRDGGRYKKWVHNIAAMQYITWLVCEEVSQRCRKVNNMSERKGSCTKSVIRRCKETVETVAGAERMGQMIIYHGIDLGCAALDVCHVS